MAKTTCISCGAGKPQRRCTVMNGLLCTRCCGTKRNSSIQCAGDCSYNPFGINNYEQWLDLDKTWGKKCLDYIFSAYNHNPFTLKQELYHYSIETDIPEERLLDTAISLFLHAKLFWEPFRDARSLAEYWEREGYAGLSKDEKVMMCYRAKTYPAVLEIQKK